MVGLTPGYKLILRWTKQFVDSELNTLVREKEFNLKKRKEIQEVRKKYFFSKSQNKDKDCLFADGY